ASARPKAIKKSCGEAKNASPAMTTIVAKSERPPGRFSDFAVAQPGQLLAAPTIGPASTGGLTRTASCHVLIALGALIGVGFASAGLSLRRSPTFAPPPRDGFRFRSTHLTTPSTAMPMPTRGGGDDEQHQLRNSSRYAAKPRHHRCMRRLHGRGHRRAF